MDNDDLTNKSPSVQKILNKLLSEEIAASMFYNGCLIAAEDKSNEAFNNLFANIAADEFNDHYNKLKSWAIANDYSVPFKLKDYSKYAEDCIKQLENLKKNKDLEYYVDEAIKSEQFALSSYNEALSNDSVPYDLNALMMQNYYDECEHYDSLSFMKYALGAGAEIV